MDKITADIKRIMKTSKLYTLEKRTEMPGTGAMTDCFRFLYKTKSGLTVSLKFRGEVPKEAERVSEEINNLYQKYNLEQYVKMSANPEELEGIWQSENKNMKLVLQGDGTYQLNETCGTYTVEKDYLMPLDILPGWDLYDHSNRYNSFEYFGNIIIKKDHLEGNIFVHDMGNLPVKFYRRK